MSELFISYASDDREIAKRLVEALERRGWTVWWDSRIESGIEWDKSIEKAISEAKCVIVLWTKNSTDSRWVRAEAREALKKNTLISVMLELDTVPLGFSGVQALQLIGWDGKSSTKEFDQLVSSVQVKLGTEGVSAESIKNSVAKNNKRSPTFLSLALLSVVLIVSLLGSWFWMNLHGKEEFSGNWKGVFEEHGADRYSVCFTFEYFNEKLFGTVRYPTGDGQIINGNIKGNQISFITKHIPQFHENVALIQFEGILKGEEIEFLMQETNKHSKFTAMKTTLIPIKEKLQNCPPGKICFPEKVISPDPCPEWKPNPHSTIKSSTI